MANVLSTQKLLASGSHFGHQTRRWNPKMERFIYTKKKGVHIIDLPKTVKLMDKAYDYVKTTVAKGGDVLFVGTKKQAKESIEEQAKRAEMPFVSQRWLGGMLTNFKTISQRIRKMSEIERMEKDGTFDQLPKKEVILLKKQLVRLEGFLGGIRKMRKMPKIMFVVDPMAEMNAILEAKKLNIKIVGMVDTNCDPDLVDFIIPSNDDAIKSIRLITTAIADACVEAKGGKPIIAFTKDEPRPPYDPSKRRDNKPYKKYDNRGPRKYDNNRGPRSYDNRGPRPARPANAHTSTPNAATARPTNAHTSTPRPTTAPRPTTTVATAPRPTTTVATAPKAAPVVTKSAPVVTKSVPVATKSAPVKSAPAKATPVKAAPAAKPATTDISKMTLAALKAEAKSRGIKGYSTKKKAEIIDMINAG